MSRIPNARFVLFASLVTLLSAVPDCSAVAAGARQLEYTVALTQVTRGQSQAEVNLFRLLCTIHGSSTQGLQVDYWISEQQRGGWAWPERFGRQQLTPGRALQSGQPVRLLQRYQDNPYIIELPNVLFDQFTRMLREREWQVGQKQYEVGREVKEKGQVAREIEVVGRLGRSHRLLVSVDDGTVLKNEQRVFMGRGDEFLLEMNLVATRELNEAEAAKRAAAFDALIALQQKLKRREGETKPELSNAQLELVAELLPAIEKQAEGTELRELIAAAGRDQNQQSRREQSVEDLARRLIGQAAPELTVKDLRLQEVDPKSLNGQILVLHFWEYQHEPLEEPYGQIGYLDFLNSKREKLGVKVLGVAVNQQLANPDSSRTALRSVRKLKEFMNLGYEIAADDGTMLRKFGDPRRFEAKLPLWVVIDPDGKIVFYKAGLFQIQPDKGLQELDEVLIGLIRKHRAAAGN